MERETPHPKSRTRSRIFEIMGVFVAGGVLALIIVSVLDWLFVENKPPEAVIILNRSVAPNSVPMDEEIVFDGSKSRDPEGKPLTYKWAVDPSSPEAASDRATLRWTFKKPRHYVVKLTVRDPEGLKMRTSMIITVQDEGKNASQPRAETVAVSVSGKHARGLREWLDTRFDVESGNILSITARGTWTFGPSPRVCDADGLPNFGIYEGFLFGTLIGRIGENGRVFGVGKKYRGMAHGSGRLYLCNNDVNMNDNSGFLEATIRSWPNAQ